MKSRKFEKDIHIKKRFLFRFIVLVMVTALLVGAFSGCTKKSTGVKVRLCEVTHSIFYAPQYVAINLGFFKEEGIEIELSNGLGADKVMAAVLSGSVDIGFSGPEAAIYVYNEGKEDYPKVFGQITQRDGQFIVAREKDDNFTWDKFKGKTILPGRKGGAPYMTLEHVIKSHGLDTNKDMVLDHSVQYGLLAGAFTGGTGDYVALFEPTASILEREGKGFIVAAVGKESGEIPYTAYYAKQSYMSDNNELIEKFLRAIYKGQKWVKEHSPAEIAEAVKDSFADSDVAVLTTVAERYKEIGVWNETPILSKESFDRLQMVMTEAGELDKTAPHDKVVDNSFAQKIIDEK